MLNAYGQARLGRDAEIRDTPAGDAVASLSLAFTIIIKREKVTQWIEGALWGARAEALAPYLLKGATVTVSLQDVHVEAFTKADGTPTSKLVGRVADIDLGSAPQAAAPAPAPQRQAAPTRQPAAQQPQRRAAPVSSTGFDDMDDDIPFARCGAEWDLESRLSRRFRRMHVRA